MNSKPLSLAVICKPSTTTKRILLGIASYVHNHLDWNLSPFESESDVVACGAESQYIGAIVIDDRSLNTESLRLLGNKLPTIVIGTCSDMPPTKRITVDVKAVAKLAVATFLDRGFQSMAYIGESNHYNSTILKTFVCDELRKRGITPFVFMGNSTASVADGNSEAKRHNLTRWLASLPDETGIFAADDSLAFEVYKIANRLGKSIPTELAILGVNDDDLLCSIANPSISSIRLPLEKMGHDAAKMMKTFVSESKEYSSTLDYCHYAPMGLIARGSTKVVVVRDAVVKAAVCYIHENYMKSINVESILEELNVSRSLLERRFRDELGITPLVELRRQRIERARALLSDSKETIYDMGKRCGFSSAIRFTTVFKEQVGMTPSEFRKQMVPNVRN